MIVFNAVNSCKCKCVISKWIYQEAICSKIWKYRWLTVEIKKYVSIWHKWHANSHFCFFSCLYLPIPVIDYVFDPYTASVNGTVKPVSNDHLYNEIYYLWFIQ